MRDKTKNIIVTIGFVVILILVFIINIIVKDKQISTTERRKLAQFPEITIKNLLNGQTAEDLEDYAVDQFVARDFFREIKAFSSIEILKQKDNNKLFEKDNAIYKMEYPLNEKYVQKSAEKISQVYDKYLKGMDVYYVIIPDKNYYLENDDHLKMDYNKLKEIMQNELSEIDYIDIWNDLTLDDYYRTDIHWKQENLSNVIKTIQNEIQLTNGVNSSYTIQEAGDFYGTYYGQLGVNVPPDTIYLLTNNIIENCTVYNYENRKTTRVYEESKTADRYDIYLSGATPLITINNPSAKNDKELLLFRDSFGSSIAPLLLENYSKITLIDLRYISSNLLEQYIDFENQDVLFLYSTLILNQNVLK